jgi:nucleotide-binding universal stress UspA family protein
MGTGLTVVGRHGQRPVRDLFIGSTAMRVIRKGDVPVLAVSRKPMHPYRRPLLALALEDASFRVVEITAQIIGPDLKVVPVVHACHVPFVGWMRPTLTQAEISSYRQEFREQASTQLAKLIHSCGDLGFRLKPVVRVGEARSVILREVARRRADMVAIGTHGRSGLSHALLGSVAEWIVEAVPCDLLVARPVPFTFELP